MIEIIKKTSAYIIDSATDQSSRKYDGEKKQNYSCAHMIFHSNNKPRPLVG